MFITIKTDYGKYIPFELCPCNTVISLKAKIWHLENISIDEQRLAFGLTTLEDHRTLNGYNIKAGDVIQLQVRAALTSKSVDIRYEGKIICSINQCLDCCTVQYVKESIQDMKGFPFNEQFLYFFDEILEDDCTLDSYDIAPGAVIDLIHIPTPIRIIIHHTINQSILYMLNVCRCYKIHSVKMHVLKELRIPIEKQRLSLTYMYGNLLDNDRTLGDYNIGNDAVLYLSEVN